MPSDLVRVELSAGVGWHNHASAREVGSPPPLSATVVVLPYGFRVRIQRRGVFGSALLLVKAPTVSC